MKLDNSPSDYSWISFDQDLRSTEETILKETRSLNVSCFPADCNKKGLGTFLRHTNYLLFAFLNV